MDKHDVRAIRTGDGPTLHARCGGRADGPTLVLVNSLGSDYRIWDGLLPQLQRRFAVVRYDKRGHGLSDTPDGPYTIAELADDLAGLLDALEVTTAVVAGISIGGMIAQSLAAARPDLVKGLVLLDTGHRIGSPESWDERMATIRQSGLEAVADAVLERWLPEPYRRARPAELRVWRNMLTRTPVDGYLGCCAAIRDADLTAATRTIDRPTLCLVGELDLATPPALVEELARLIKGARSATLPGSGHLPCIDQPQLVARLILDFLEEHELG
jgi:3-oxoadipate enol-lactonase